MRRVTALHEPVPVESNSGLVYSANPLEVLADDGNSYILKGPDPGVAFAEAAAYELAGVVGLAVPPFATCSAIKPKTGQEVVYFASQKLPLRMPLEPLLSSGEVDNRQLLSEMIAFDLWVANSDRNINNVVAEPTERGGVRLCAIDFEQAEVLRGRRDRFTVTAMPSIACWPREEMGRLCRRETELPHDFLSRIHMREKEDNRAILDRVVWGLDLASIGWLDAAAALLAQRAGRIREMAREIWT